MIKGITGSSYIKVEGGYPIMPATNYNSAGKDLVGQMKYNSLNQNIEVWDGNIWQTIGSTFATVTLEPAVQKSVDWATKKMIEEEFYSSHKHPAMQAAYENYQRARQQLEATAILVKEDYNNEQSTS